MQQVPSATNIAVIAIGGNTSDKDISIAEYVAHCRLPLITRIGKLYKSSRYFRTPAFPRGSGPDFVNAVIGIETEMAAQQVLAVLHQIEAEFGRVRTKRWGARTLDLDLICMGELVLPDEAGQTRWRNLALADQMTQAPSELILPHPRLQDRSFVLVPMAEVVPNWRHPVLGLTVTQMRDARPDAERAEIVPL